MPLMPKSASARVSSPPKVPIHLIGPAGEPVSLRRTFLSHGIASLPPAHLDTTTWVLEVTLPVDGGYPRTVQIAAAQAQAVVSVSGRLPSRRVMQHLVARVRHMLRLEEDLSAFYTLAMRDPALRWATKGGGRMMRGATVFEDVIKTICTTNCT